MSSYYKIVSKFTAHDLYKSTTTEYPFGIYIPDHEMDMIILHNVLQLCQGSEFIVWDGPSRIAPVGILFSRIEDYTAMVSFMIEWKVNHDTVQYKNSWAHDLRWESLITKLQSHKHKENFH